MLAPRLAGCGWIDYVAVGLGGPAARDSRVRVLADGGA
jgi:hypothetical protein